MFEDILKIIVKPYIQYIAWFLVIFISAMLGGLFVKKGDGWGKILFSNYFQNKKTLFIWVILELVILSIVAIFIQNSITIFLLNNIELFIPLLLEIGLIFYIWFCTQFGYKIHYNYSIFFQIFVLVLGWIFSY